MRSWIWGGALATLTALGVSWSVAPPRPTELVLDPTPVAACCAAPVECLAVTDALDVLGELRAGVPRSEEPPLAPPRADGPGEVIPAVFLLPAADDEEAPQPRAVLELAPTPRPHDSSIFIGGKLEWRYTPVTGEK